ncbi:uncharacterized protein AMSG_07382 [Thecamonas trahens ATCC 50062]|uniref:USP domain-containing protein n=1 Tax=Thecamonas trahens ATCC 50062 TaxID=461836 RepID=A0A0L0DGW2_THETB|nr:hypothetical protein AMSG_07382 [Thecamonas trahens ATCC 50062]KNC51366.1 hypothetical protein AMSG_07382 [Thecamonas trahens ATCC 50062]|eukprot:XP_013756284.1 hypothetical protein AMSG_07382 [Thecamonas trahens ATCC 50062]
MSTSNLMSGVHLAGLSNQGATCYLNALLQILYHTPPLRNGVLSLSLEDMGHTSSEYLEWLLSNDAEVWQAKYGSLTEEEVKAEKNGVGGKEIKSGEDALDLAAAIADSEPVMAEVLAMGLGLDPELVVYCVAKHVQNAAIASACEESYDLFALGGADDSSDDGSDGLDAAELTAQSLLDMCLDTEYAEEYAEDVADGRWVDPRTVAPVFVAGSGSAEPEKAKFVPPPPAPDRIRTIPFALQRLFAALSLHTAVSGGHGAVTTHFLTAAFGFSGRDAGVQHDIAELTRLLLDVLQRQLVGSAIEGLVPGLYRGVASRRISCLTCGGSRSTEQPFLDLSLPTAGAASLDAALLQWGMPELMDGANAVSCEACDSRQPSTIRNVLTLLPPVLTITLNRYAWTESGRVKLNDPFAFPLTLDMAALLDGESLAPDDSLRAAAAELAATGSRSETSSTRASAGAGGDDGDDFAFSSFGLFSDPAPVASPEPDTAGELFVSRLGDAARGGSPAEYELFGVVLHAGGAHGGHYHALIRDAESGQWFDFNDASVKPMPLGQLVRSYGVSGSSRESAYMLFYAARLPDGSLAIDVPIIDPAPAPTAIEAHLSFWRKHLRAAASAAAAREAAERAARGERAAAAVAARSSREATAAALPMRPAMRVVERTPHTLCFLVYDAESGAMLPPVVADAHSLVGSLVQDGGWAFVGALVPSLAGGIVAAATDAVIDTTLCVGEWRLAALAEFGLHASIGCALAHVGALVVAPTVTDGTPCFAAVPQLAARRTEVTVFAAGNGFRLAMPCMLSMHTLKSLIVGWLNDELELGLSPHAVGIYACSTTAAPGYSVAWALESGSDPLGVAPALEARGGAVELVLPLLADGVFVAELDDVDEPLEIRVVARSAASRASVSRTELEGAMTLTLSSMTPLQEAMSRVAGAGATDLPSFVLRPTDAGLVPRPDREVFVSRTRALSMYHIRPHTVLVAEPGRIVALGQITVNVVQYAGYPSSEGGILAFFSPAYYTESMDARAKDLFSPAASVSIGATATVDALYDAVASALSVGPNEIRLWATGARLKGGSTGNLKTVGIRDGSVVVAQVGVAQTAGSDVILPLYERSGTDTVHFTFARELVVARDAASGAILASVVESVIDSAASGCRLAKYDQYANTWATIRKADVSECEPVFANDGDVVVYDGPSLGAGIGDDAEPTVPLPQRVLRSKSGYVFHDMLALPTYREEAVLRIDAGGW